MTNGSQIDVFVSYARSDAEFVRAFADLLRECGFVVWTDSAILAGEEWRVPIVEALARTQVFLLVHSGAAERSPEVAKELAVAAGRRMCIVPVRVEDCKPSGAFLYEMARLNWVDCFPPTSERMQMLAVAFSELLRGGADDAAIQRFAAAVDARQLGERAILRLTRNNFVVILAAVAVSALLLAAYERSSGFLETQAVAGVPFGDSLRSAILVVTLGAPFLFVMSLARLDRPWMWAVTVLAALNTLLALLLLRNGLNWARRRVAIWLAQRRPPGLAQ